jgi:hypothetical protein
MTKQKRITVRGAQRADIDPSVLLQIMLAIGDNWDAPKEDRSSADVFNAAIEDVEESAR